MRVCNLSSGSDGNITYIESESAKILVDIGLSCQKTEERLALLGVKGNEINAILITHEHTDHIKGLKVFANKYKTPVFVHEDGLEPLLKKIDKPINLITFNNNEFKINDLVINTVAVPHDVKRCTGYIIKEKNKKISIITDLGHTTNEILQNIVGSKLVFLEANHDTEKLKNNCHYPYYLKKRILAMNGHLSNDDCAKTILKLVQSGTQQIVLSHLSKENNSPDFAFKYITNYLSQYGIIEGEHLKIDVASSSPKTIFKI